MAMPKQILRSLVENLPEDCDWHEFYYRLYVAKKLEAAVRESENGRTYTMEEARQMLEEKARQRMENPREHYVTVHSRQQLVDYLFHVQDEVLDSPSKDVHRETAEYLDALKSWLDTCEGFYRSIDAPIDAGQPSWQLFADALRAAVRYC